jgi:hypothetical protein
MRTRPRHGRQGPRRRHVVEAVLAERSPDVIVCANDLTAALLIQSVARLP